MKKFLLLLFVVCLTSGMNAQTKKISRVEVYENDDAVPSCIYDFHYDEYGRMLGSDWERKSGYAGSIRLTYNDIDNTIRIEDFEERPDLEWTVAYVENGRITKLDGKYRDEDVFTSYYTYNNADEVISSTIGMEYYGETYTSDLKWLNGNIVNVTSGNDGWYEFSLSDYDSPDSLPFFMELIDGVDGFDLPNPSYYLPDYMGKRTKKLLAGYTAQIGYTKLQCIYSYRFDAEGDISEITEQENEDGHTWHRRIVCSYTTVSGINDVSMNRHNNYKVIYNAAGQLRPYVGKGLNIIKTADGTVKKVVVK